MKSIINLLLLLFCFMAARSQSIPATDSLKNELQKAETSERKIEVLQQLTNWFLLIDRQEAAGYVRMEEGIAETSRDRRLLYRSLLDNAKFQLHIDSRTRADSCIYYVQKVIRIAKEENDKYYVASGALLLSKAIGINGDNEKEMSYINDALAIAANLHSDSLEYECHITYAEVYNARKEKLKAFRNYVTALNIAETMKDSERMLATYSGMSNFYYSLGKYNKAKDYAYKALDMTFKNNDLLARIDLYASLGLIYTDDKSYDLASSFFEKGLQLADSLKLPVVAKVRIYERMMRQYFLMSDYEKTFRFFNSKQDLHQYYTEAGNGYFAYLINARLFAYTGKMDSALYYFKQAEPLVDSFMPDGSKNLFYDWYADYFHKKGDYNNAIIYYTKAKNICGQTNDLDNLIKATANLDTMYQQLGDYKAAYGVNKLYHVYKDSLKKLTNERDLTSAEIDQETLQREKALMEQELAREKRYNIQYMGITAALALFLIVLTMAGLFKVSITTIKAFGFFTFICLFEFIIVLADTKIHEITHGEPWQVLLFKIGLACMLVPLHHFTEKKVINYLTLHHLLNRDKKNIFASLFKRKLKKVQKPAKAEKVKED